MEYNYAASGRLCSCTKDDRDRLRIYPSEKELLFVLEDSWQRKRGGLIVLSTTSGQTAYIASACILTCRPHRAHRYAYQPSTSKSHRFPKLSVKLIYVGINFYGFVVQTICAKPFRPARNQQLPLHPAPQECNQRPRLRKNCLRSCRSNCPSCPIMKFAASRGAHAFL